MIYPWQQDTWQQLLGSLARLPHALLLHGAEGGGKVDFAEALAARLLCETAKGADAACGECLACKWFADGNHPDYRQVVPESVLGEAVGDEEGAEAPSKEKKLSDQILIAQIRGLAGFLTVGTHRQGRRVVLIRPAEAMNAATANSLLKLLEEPIAETCFILVSDNLTRLLPTIRSRCRLVSFPKPSPGLARDWLLQQHKPEAAELLALAGGMPLTAVELGQGETLVWRRRFLAAVSNPAQENPLRLAVEWEGWLKPPKDSGGERLEMPTLVGWLQKWLFDLVLVRLGAPAMFHPESAAKLAALAQKPGVPALFACYNDLLRARAVARHPLNTRLYLEDMLLRYARLFS